MVPSGFDDAGRDFVEGQLIRLDSEVGGFVVKGGAGLKKVANRSFGIVGLEKGAVGVSRGPVEDLGGVGDEPDHIPKVSKEGSVFWASDDSAPGSDDVARMLGERLEDLGFKIPESLLALIGEDFRNRAAFPLHN